MNEIVYEPHRPEISSYAAIRQVPMYIAAHCITAAGITLDGRIFPLGGIEPPRARAQAPNSKGVE